MSDQDKKYLAIQANAQMADSFTPGSNYYTQTASDSKAPLLMIAFDRVEECFANERRTKHAAFLQKTYISLEVRFVVQENLLAVAKHGFGQQLQLMITNDLRFFPKQVLHYSGWTQLDPEEVVSTA